MVLAQGTEDITGTVGPDGLVWKLTFAVLILPPIISIINQKHWRQEVKALTMVAVCIVYSMITVLINPTTDLRDWRNVFGEVLIGTCVVYKIFWNTSTLGPKLEAKTTIAKPPVGADDATSTATLDDKTFAERLIT